MNRQRLACVAGLTLLVAISSGCDARGSKPIGQTLSNYQKPAGWIGECVGRFAVDVPRQTAFGAAAGANEFGENNKTYASEALRHSGRDSGEFLLAGAHFLETTPFAKSVDEQRLRSQFQNGFQYARTNAGSDDVRNAFTEVFGLPSNAFGWRGAYDYQFAFISSVDSRARLISGRAEPQAVNSNGFDELAAVRTKNQAELISKDFLPRYTPRTPGTIPTTPGICTPYGFFADPAKTTERDYVFDMRFRDPKHSNLVLGISIKTRNEQTTGAEIRAKNIRDAVTPWDHERQSAREEKENCRAQQGTASRDIFGCAFAGMTNIKDHRKVEYLQLANGQEARLLVMEYAPALNEYTAYDVRLETAGVENSATEPRIVISARGIDGGTDEPALRGKNPPPIDEAVKYVRQLAMSLRLRPDAVDPARPVVDSLDGVR